MNGILPVMKSNEEPMRIQIALYDKVVAEAIIKDYATAISLWNKWTLLRYQRNEPIGCAVINRADRKRLFQ
jgi:hypothetical protein